MLGPRRSGNSFEVALVIPLQGPAGIFGPSCEHCAVLACDEVNASGGVLARPLALHVVDGANSPRKVAAEVGSLVDSGMIDAVVGWHISAVRVVLAPLLSGRVPYIYTALYEGGERTPGVFLTGEVPSRQLLPPLRWLSGERNLRRWCVVGDDYIWPRLTAEVLERHGRDYGATILDSHFVPLGTTDFHQVLRRVEASDPDGVLMLLVGQDAVEFNRLFASAGLDASYTRFSPLMDENMLLATGADNAAGLCAAAGYFESLLTAESLEFEAHYVQRFGPDAPSLNSLGESCYEGIKLLASLIQGAGTADVQAMCAVADSVSYDGPRGTLHLFNSHVDQRVYLAEARDLEFDVVTQV